MLLHAHSQPSLHPLLGGTCFPDAYFCQFDIVVGSRLVIIMWLLFCICHPTALLLGALCGVFRLKCYSASSFLCFAQEHPGYSESLVGLSKFPFSPCSYFCEECR